MLQLFSSFNGPSKFLTIVLFFPKARKHLYLEADIVVTL